MYIFTFVNVHWCNYLYKMLRPFFVCFATIKKKIPVVARHFFTIKRCCLTDITSVKFPLNTRQSHGRFIFFMGIPIHKKMAFISKKYLVLIVCSFHRMVWTLSIVSLDDKTSLSSGILYCTFSSFCGVFFCFCFFYSFKKKSRMKM